MLRHVFDTTFIVKGLVEPRRKKMDKEYSKQLRLHKKAKEYLEKVEKNEITMIIPSIALIETASVVSRLTNSKDLAKDSVKFLMENAEEILFDFETLDKAIEMGIKTKASGFDNLYLTVTKITESTLLTDDSALHNLAKKEGFKSILLREII